MNDPELFELCQEVHKRLPEWGDEIRDWWHKGSEVNGGNYTSSYHGHEYEKKLVICPLYTSDYILEKLELIVPQNGGSSSDFFFHLTPGFTGDEKWLAKYQGIDEGQLVAEYGKSATIALLKLVIALDDAKELPHA